VRTIISWAGEVQGQTREERTAVGRHVSSDKCEEAARVEPTAGTYRDGGEPPDLACEDAGEAVSQQNGVPLCIAREAGRHARQREGAPRLVRAERHRLAWQDATYPMVDRGPCVRPDLRYSQPGEAFDVQRRRFSKRIDERRELRGDEYGSACFRIIERTTAVRTARDRQSIARSLESRSGTFIVQWCPPAIAITGITADPRSDAAVASL
jgi:hypothetical protein